MIRNVLNAESLQKNLANAIQWACLAMSAVFLALFLYIVFKSISFPYPLEFIEAHIVSIVERVRKGLPIYVKPSIEYVTFLYTPFYYYVSVAVSYVTGMGFLPLRLVSIVSSLVSGYIIYAWVVKQGGSVKEGLIAAGLFFATYPLSGRWFDDGRVDSLFLTLSLAGLYAAHTMRGRHAVVTASVLLTLAFFTKQSALIVMAPFLVIGIILEQKRGLKIAGLTGAFILSLVWLANTVSNGWFLFFVFDVPAGHGFKQHLWFFWHSDILHFFIRAVVLILASFGLMLYKGHTRKCLEYVALLAGFTISSYVGRQHLGGYLNVLMPVYAALALISGLCLAWLHKNVSPNIYMAGLVLMCLQLGSLLYKPNHFIPTQTQKNMYDKFLNKIGSIKGDILMPEIQFIQERVGKTNYILGTAAWDLERSNLKDKNYIKQAFLHEVNHAVKSGRFAAIIPSFTVDMPDLDTYYHWNANMEKPYQFDRRRAQYTSANIYLRDDDK